MPKTTQPGPTMDPTVMVGRMPMFCQVCERQYDSKPCTAEQDGKTGHGLCGPGCQDAYRRWVKGGR